MDKPLGALSKAEKGGNKYGGVSGRTGVKGNHGNWEKVSQLEGENEELQTQISHLTGFSYFQKLKNKGALGRKLVIHCLDCY